MTLDIEMYLDGRLLDNLGSTTRLMLLPWIRISVLLIVDWKNGQYPRLTYALISIDDYNLC